MPPQKRTSAPAKPKTRVKRKPRKRKIITFSVKIALFRCARCRQKYNNPFTHVCLIGFSASEAKAVRRTAAQREASRRNLRKAREQA
jgi:hypothetical protein